MMPSRAHLLFALSLLGLALGCGKSTTPHLIQGAPCQWDAECASGLCADGVCVQPPAAPDSPETPATPDAGDAPDGGTEGCLIDGQRREDGEKDPSNPCRACRSAVSRGQWTPEPTGEVCGEGQVCRQGACVEGCFINGAVVAPGATHPTNACEVCDPSKSTSAYSPREEGTSCGAGRVCSANACQAGCFIDGAFLPIGQRNPNSDCELCDPSRSTTRWTYACFDYYLPHVPRQEENGTSATVVLQDTRDPALVPADNLNRVQATFRKPDGSLMGGESLAFGPGSQFTLTVDPNVLVVPGGQMARSTVHTASGAASLHLRAYHPVQVLTYLRPPDFGDTSTANDATAYSAPASASLGAKLYVPRVVKQKDGRWTSLTVMNTSNRAARVTLTFLDVTGGVVAGPFNPLPDDAALPPQGSVWLDQRTQVPALPAGFEGSLLIESTPEVSLAAVVHEWGPTGPAVPAVGFSSWTGTSLSVTLAGLPFLANSSGSGSVVGPVTGLALLNTGATEASGQVSVTGQAAPFGPLAPWATGFLPGSTWEAGFSGPGWLSASQPMVGLVLEDSHVTGAVEGRIATAWDALSADDAAQTLYLPMYFVNGGASQVSRRSGDTRVQLVNFGPRDDLVQVTFRDPAGKASLNTLSVLVPRQGVAELPAPQSLFFGTVVVRGSAADSKLRALVRVTEGSGTSQSVWSYSAP